jgi:hypothetical protein
MKVAVTIRHWQIDFVNIRDHCHGRAGCEVFLEFIHCVPLALSYHLDTPIGQVADGAKYLMAGSCAQNKEAIADALDHT